MVCPQCNNDEVDASGKCSICGYQVELNPTKVDSTAVEKETNSFNGAIEMDSSNNQAKPQQNDTLPMWRQELSQRLQTIRQKRESAGGVDRPKIETDTPPSADFQSRTVEKPTAPPIQFAAKTSDQDLSQKTRPASDGSGEEGSDLQRARSPRQQTMDSLDPRLFKTRPIAKTDDSRRIPRLIDGAVSKQLGRSGTQSSFAKASLLHTNQPGHHSGKLILLSRTLSGLIDLIFIVLCMGIFIIAADVYSGIIVMDLMSFVVYSALFLLIYFVYSVIFLATSNQTIGMMITNLRVVGIDKSRPLLGQLLSRCCAYLISLFGLGIGLLWGIFDRESSCFHDRFSRTRVIRI